MKVFTTSKVFLASLVFAASTQAQSLTTELDLTTGYSTEARTWAGSTQLRTFGEVHPKIQFNLEGTWARRSTNTTDAFGAAYPYGGHVQLSEAYFERSFQRGPVIASVRGGQYRSPFGIYSRADHGYSGFLRAPLLRSEYYWSINSTMLERGVDVTFGTARLSAEVSIATPGDNTDQLKRHSGLDSVVRVQAYYKSVVVGASHINSKSYSPDPDLYPGRMDFSGIDVRWMYGGVQLRGEWIIGQQWNGSRTNAGYVDAIIHPRFMGPVTAVFRTEQLSWFEAPRTDYDWHGFRQTAGARLRIPGGLTAQFNVLHHSKLVATSQRTAFDIALTYSIRDRRNKIEK